MSRLRMRAVSWQPANASGRSLFTETVFLRKSNCACSGWCAVWLKYSAAVGSSDQSHMRPQVWRLGLLWYQNSSPVQKRSP